jgi:hypothetical protein
MQSQIAEIVVTAAILTLGSDQFSDYLADRLGHKVFGAPGEEEFDCLRNRTRSVALLDSMLVFGTRFQGRSPLESAY